MEVESTQHSLLLPEEIVNEEILPKLAVKSLLRFRCVSKSWRSLIDSKRFARIQLQNSTKSTSLSHQRQIVVMIPKHTVAVQQCSFLSLLNNQPDTHASEFTFPTEIPIHSVSLVGCCNGLVCVALNEQEHGRTGELILWNPSTRMTKKLPHNTNTTYACWGFGWDESSGDYKVATFDLYHEGQSSTANIYSLESDAWKKVDVPYAPSGYNKRGLLLGKGKLHWMSGKLGRIDCFDLEGEALETVEPPPLSEVSRSWGYLGNIQECLVVYHWYTNNDSVGDVWFMKEYGVKESWEKLMVIDRSFCPTCISPSMDLFRIDREGGISMTDSRTSIIDDVRSHLGILPVVSEVCVESLVSPLG